MHFADTQLFGGISNVVITGRRQYSSSKPWEISCSKFLIFAWKIRFEEKLVKNVHVLWILYHLDVDLDVQGQDQDQTHG